MNARDFFELDAKQNSWAHAYLIIGQNDEKIKELTNYVIKQKKCLPADVSVVIPEDLSGKKGEVSFEPKSEDILCEDCFNKKIEKRDQAIKALGEEVPV